ncbi:MAG: accessory factor UbiK family protein [Alphaproteobacteria bacterium]
MNARRRVLDDIAKLATSAVGVAQGAGREAEELVRQRLERVLDRMELVSRDEFEAVKAMAQAAREENERLAARIAELEAKAKPARARKTATKSRAKKS